MVDGHTASGGGPCGDRVVLMAMDHVRLCYDYLNAGDIDGYVSLFEGHAVLYQPGFPPVRGRACVERFERQRPGPTTHVVAEVFGAGRRVTAVGTLIQPGLTSGEAHSQWDFADLFVVSDRALVVERRSFFHVPVGWPPQSP